MQKSPKPSRPDLPGRLETRSAPVPGLTCRQSAPVSPGTYNAESRSLRVVACTEQPAQVFDYDRWEVVTEVLHMSGAVLPANGRCPLLDSHDRSAVECILGSAGDFQMTATGGFEALDCEIVFAGTDDGAKAATLFAEGHLTDVSIGYRVIESFWIPEGQKQVIGGKTYEGPVKVVTAFEIKELSATPIGADSLAKARAEQHGGNDVMKLTKKQRKMLAAMGLRADATMEQALAFLAALDDQKRTEVMAARDDADADGSGDAGAAESGSASAAESGGASSPPAPEQRQDQAPAAPAADSGARAVEIMDACRAVGMGELARDFVARGMSVVDVNAELLRRMAAANPNLGGTPRIQAGADERDKFRAAAADAIALRCGLVIAKPAPGAEDLRSLGLFRTAQECLERAGVKTRLMSKFAIAEAAVRSVIANGVSDFPNVITSSVNAILRSAYISARSTYEVFTRIVPADDFTDMDSIQLSEAPDLDLIGPAGEYLEGHLSDSKESYAVKKYGKILTLTLEAIVNDRLKAFARLPQLFGAAAKRKENELVYKIFTANPKMGDGVALFDAAHGNLAGTPAALSSDALGVGRKAMRLQTGLDGTSMLNIAPKFLIVPAALEQKSDVILNSIALPEADMSSGVANIWRDRLTPVVSSWLDASSETAFFLAADNGDIDTVEAAFLDGNSVPTVVEQESFRVDGVQYKIRHIFGCKAIDHRGLYKNAGA